jgi:D-3-phosphoglycerate dehydrogenase
MRIHILDDWFDTLRGLPSFERLKGHEVTISTDHEEDSEQLAVRLADAEALVLFRERTPVTEDLLARLPGLKLISQRSVYPHVDVEACTRHKVLLCSNMHADGHSVAAAELTWALILACARQLVQQNASLRAGHWQMGVGQTLAGRVVGLYGYGRIARAVARYAKAFDMKVQWWASDEGRVRAKADGVNVAESREVFFASSDFVSMHVRLNSETRGIITEADLERMKPTASFINTSRAGLVASGALLHSLNRGRPGRAGIDVFETEPMTDPKDALICHPGAIATPHIGYVTEDELDTQFGDIYDQINAYAEGGPINMINPSVWIGK